MTLRRFILFALCLLSFGASAVPTYITFPADVDWVTRDSDHFRVLYRRGQDAFASRALRNAERVYKNLTPHFPEAPEQTWIVLGDFNDITNGYSLDLPWPHMVLFAVPADPSSELAYMDDWLYSLILHEYVHTLHIYPAHGLWKPLRTIFGSVILPNGLLPTHLHEGLATFFETQLTGGGRGKGTYFKMSRRMAVEAGTWNRDARPMDRMDGALSIFPGGATPYLFGYHLYDELWRRKGSKGIHDYVLSTSSNWPFLFQNGPLEEVYGIDFAQAWDSMFARTGETTKKEIATIKQTTLSGLDYLTNTKFSKLDLALSPDGKKAIYRRGDPAEGGSFEVLDLESRKILDNLVFHAGGLDGMCWGKSPKGERVVFLRNSGNDFYTYNTIAVYEMDSKRSGELTRKKGDQDKHFRALGCSPDLSRFVVYRETAGKGEMIAMTWDGDTGKGGYVTKQLKMWAVPEGAWISGAVAGVGGPDYFLLRQGTTTTLYRWDERSATPLMEMNGHVYNMKPGRRPGELLAVAGIDGRDEVWALNPDTRVTRKVVSLLGGVNSFAARGGDFIVSSYRDGGYDIARATTIDVEAQKISTRKITSVTRRPASDVKMGEVSSYSATSTLFPRMWFPNFLFVPDGYQVGIYIPGFDIAQKHFYDIIAGYDSRGLPYGIFDYTYRLSNPISLTVAANYLPAYYYSASGFLKRWGTSVGVDWEIGSGLPHLTLSALFNRREASKIAPDPSQYVGASIGVSQSWGISAKPLDISTRKGTRVSVSHSQFFKQAGSTNNFFQTSASLDQYVPAPWWNGHIFYLGLRGGYTEGAPRIDSYFETGGDLLFYQYREYFLNRGFDYAAIPISRRIVNANFEYRFPIARVERGIGLWPLFLKDIHAALVSDVTTRDLGTYQAQNNPVEIFNVYYVSAGLELRTDWTFSYYLPGQITFGIYHGFNPADVVGRPAGQSLMFSLGLQAAL